MPACGWSVTSCGCSKKCLDGYSPAQRTLATTLAINHMWAATGRRYGLCELTVLPCNPTPMAPLYQTYPIIYSGRGDGGDSSATLTFPFIDADGEWRNAACGSGCSCRARCETTLDGPVHSVVEVTIDAAIVPVSAYRVEDGHLLVRVDGECWPSCVMQGAEVPGFTATYLRGEVIPPAVQAAAEILTCEFAKACVGADCALPQRLTSLTRQGVSVEVAPSDFSTEWYLTDVVAVDRVIRLENPGKLHSRPVVMSPDLHSPRRITWQGGS